MKISYTWLKDYISLSITPQEVADILIQTGLEVVGIEEVETVRGGLKGLVIGEVTTCCSHPNSDHLKLTKVNIGTDEDLPIVCGAPNVDKGQKVVVAPVGTTLYSEKGEFRINKSKIRGEVSMGMICAEDEIGIGTDHSGIIVLPQNAQVGTLACEYFDVQSDYVIEIDLTPNRIDGASHIGVARDLAAFLSQNGECEYSRPSVEAFSVDNCSSNISVKVDNPNACSRYGGLSISGIVVKESPQWLQDRLKLIGLKPINSVVDVTNYVLFETGQPLHAFDADIITSGRVVVKTLPGGTIFTTLDEVERKLHSDDLMICNGDEPMCIGGVLGGLASGVKSTTTSIFLESAYFNPVYIRKTSRNHGLSTDSSFRFERGVDPNNTIYALKRAALLIREIAGGSISSDIVDVVADSSVMESFSVSVSYKNIDRLIGKEIPRDKIKSIISSLEVKIVSETATGLELLVPPFRVDVKREADVIEEILRIYGYNNVEPATSVKSTIQSTTSPDKIKLQNLVSEMLSANGFNEIMSNSLTRASYYDDLESFSADETVRLFNPLSSDLNGMRQSLIFGGLEAISRNIRYKNPDLRLYEFGNVYRYDKSKETDNLVNKFLEEEHVGLWVTGSKEPESWTANEKDSSFYTLKSFLGNIFLKAGISTQSYKVGSLNMDIFSDALEYKLNNVIVAQIGCVNKKLLERQDIDANVYYAELNWSNILKVIKNQKPIFTELPKYPEVRRDLALMIDKEVKFDRVKELAFKTERKLLREVNVFDVYEGRNFPAGKKSYAVSFILRDDKKTLNDKTIDKVMKRLIDVYEREIGAQLR